MRILVFLPALLLVLFSVYWVVVGGFTSKFSLFGLLDWIALLAIPASVVISYISSRYLKKRGLTLAERFTGGFVVLASLASIAGITLNDPEDRTTLVVLVLGLFTIAGWVYTNYVNIRNANTAHTMSILLQMRNSADLNKHRTNIMQKIPYGERLTLENMQEMTAARRSQASKEKLEETSLGDSIRYVLNYYEFICAGIVLGDLNERLIRNTMRSIFINFHDLVYVFIEDAINDDYGVKNERIYEHFRNIVQKFRES